MNKNFILLFLSLFIMTIAHSQESANGPMDKTILEQADHMGRLFIAKDYAAFIKYTHPAVLAQMGGEEKLLQTVKESFSALEAEGVTFLNVTFTAPSLVVVHDNELQCTLSQAIEMKVVGGTMTVYATLIAVSRDGGKNWYFVDTAGNDLQNMGRLISNLSPALVLPEAMEPAFVNDPEVKP